MNNIIRIVRNNLIFIRLCEFTSVDSFKGLVFEP